MSDLLNAAEIRATLAHLLAGAAGGTEARWSALIGEVRVQSVMLDIHCNWRVAPAGTDDERAAIAKAVRLLAEAEPYASA